jgi:hypothetical protein
MTFCVGRRMFITLIGGAAAAWPLAGRAQQRGGMRRIGVLMNIAADDPEAPVRVAAFAQGLLEKRVHFTGTRFPDRHAPAPHAGRYWSGASRSNTFKPKRAGPLDAGSALTANARMRAH